MAATPSTMVELGRKAFQFVLPDTVTGNTFSLDQLKGSRGTVIMFICNHCPYVKHVAEEIANIAREYKAKEVAFIAISSNDVDAYPEDGPDRMKEVALQMDYTFPYLYDETQKVAQAYDAACTPDFFVYDKDLMLAYRGQLDDSRPGNEVPVTGHDLRKALDEILEGKEVSFTQRPSIGCNIKWKS
jgi:thiol-disulfide isomerase/thioredoxin